MAVVKVVDVLVVEVMVMVMVNTLVSRCGTSTILPLLPLSPFTHFIHGVWRWRLHMIITIINMIIMSHQYVISV